MGAARGLIVSAGGARVIRARRYTADRRGGVATLAPGRSDPRPPCRWSLRSALGGADGRQRRP
jgi:hypothetical protein